MLSDYISQIIEDIDKLRLELFFLKGAIRALTEDETTQNQPLDEDILI